MESLVEVAEVSTVAIASRGGSRSGVERGGAR
jgi:hypothetical protein